MFKKIFNWNIWKPILIGFAWVISLGGIIVLMSFIEVKKAAVVCKDVKIYIPGNQYFIDKQEVENIILVSSSKLIGRKMDNINMHDIETKLNNNPFIEMARVYADMDGILNIEISQRQPVLRVMNQYDQDFYIDQHGMKIPTSDNFTAKVLAVNGFLDEPFAQKVDTIRTQLMKDVFKTAQFITNDELWNAQIAQIYVNQNHEIELIPRVGSNRILLGDADSLQTKFNNLKTFYKKAIPQVGWDAYKVINIKYANQVIGIKSDSARIDTSTVKKDTSLIIKH